MRETSRGSGKRRRRLDARRSLSLPLARSPLKMLKWVVFSKPEEFRKRVVVSEQTEISIK